jgi:hypothetical protein
MARVHGRLSQVCHRRSGPGVARFPLAVYRERIAIRDAHGVVTFGELWDGVLLEILPTARRMTYRGAVIGIRARGLVRGERPHCSVHAMAADYLTEIKRTQPTGPYHLCG